MNDSSIFTRSTPRYIELGMRMKLAMPRGGFSENGDERGMRRRDDE